MNVVLKGLSLALTAMALLATAAVAQGPIGRLLTREQEALVQQKLDAKQQAGLPIADIEGPAEGIATEQEPVVSFSTERLTVVLPSIDEALELEAEYLAAVEELAGPESAAEVREMLRRELKADVAAMESMQDSSGKQIRVIEVPRVVLGFGK